MLLRPQNVGRHPGRLQGAAHLGGDEQTHHVVAALLIGLEDFLELGGGDLGGVGQLLCGRQLLVKLLVGNIEVGAVALSPKFTVMGSISTPSSAQRWGLMSQELSVTIFTMCVSNSFSDAIFQAAPGAPAAYFCLL